MTAGGPAGGLCDPRFRLCLPGGSAPSPRWGGNINRRRQSSKTRRSTQPTPVPCGDAHDHRRKRGGRRALLTAAVAAVAGVDAELVEAGRTLVQLIDPAGSRAGKYAVDNGPGAGRWWSARPGAPARACSMTANPASSGTARAHAGTPSREPAPVPSRHPAALPTDRGGSGPAGPHPRPHGRRPSPTRPTGRERSCLHGTVRSGHSTHGPAARPGGMNAGPGLKQAALLISGSTGRRRRVRAFATFPAPGRIPRARTRACCRPAGSASRGWGAGAGDMTMVVHVVGRNQGRDIAAAQGPLVRQAQLGLQLGRLTDRPTARPSAGMRSITAS